MVQFQHDDDVIINHRKQNISIHHKFLPHSGQYCIIDFIDLSQTLRPYFSHFIIFIFTAGI